jgi:hypothetical protein
MKLKYLRAAIAFVAIPAYGRKPKGIATAAILGAMCLFPRVPAVAAIIVDPDASPAGTDITNSFPGVTLTTRDGLAPGTNSRAVTSAIDALATTGTRVFAHDSGNTTWGDGTFEFLRADFAGGATSVSLDFFANDSGGDRNAELLAFNAANVQVAINTVTFIPANTFATLTVSASSISYVAAYWDRIAHIENGGLDNLRYEPIPEPSMLTLLTIVTFTTFATGRRKSNCP